MSGNLGSMRADAGLLCQARPRALAEVPLHSLASLVGVMTDIDDTLTTYGRLEAATAAALLRLAKAGVPVVAITGRPLGWSRDFLQASPAAATLRAIVAENGAVALLPGPQGVQLAYAQDAATRQHNTLRLHGAAAQILAAVPGALLARDSPGRVTDMAVDHSEFTQLPPAAIERVLALMRQAGMTATVSSIHINGWFGTHNKWTGAQWMARHLFGRDLEADIQRWVYLGDSTNDQLMFERFPLAVGVANLRDFAAQLTVWPAYITQAERGAGFCELAEAVLAARQSFRPI